MRVGQLKTLLGELAHFKYFFFSPALKFYCVFESFLSPLTGFLENQDHTTDLTLVKLNPQVFSVSVSSTLSHELFLTLTCHGKK